MTNPKVSIIIPVFNTSKYLKKSISSCINQTFKNIEIIIIDDKSTDSSLKVIESFSDSRIKLIKNTKNLGTFLARKEGIKIARGEYIIFLDSDDYLLENSVSLLLDSIKDACMIHFGIMHKPIIKYATLPKIHINELRDENITKEIIIDNFNKSWLNLAGRMYKTKLIKDSIEKIDFIDRHLISSEDTILFFIITLLAKKSIGIDENLYIYCQNDSSITRVRTQEKLQKQIDDRTYLKEVLKIIQNNKDLNSHKYFKQSLKKIDDMLSYFICFSKKFICNDDIILPYLKYSIISMKYMPRWQILVKMIIYLLTFGKKQL
ncbi:glycosyltransferase [Helicobacter sp. MIT 99-5507]|uniref:glycosyltransferase family 2 protein n=1 Tax=Helicobacter sp. MIT 99-5507 TaxID=152489 RepID=UPI000E1F59B5|nr:glycosyltransferase [Helicobacter sp. MIT 99-5507]RDU58298.1 hypothetical protein CQA42_00390 [Helicobacter sp. MIT 99-5507]